MTNETEMPELCSPYYDGSMQPDTDGGWVSLDDYKDLCDAKDKCIEELEAKLERAEGLLVDAMVQLENGKIKTRRNRAYLIGKFLAELKGETDE